MSKRAITIAMVALIIFIVLFTVGLWLVQTAMQPVRTTTDELALVPVGGKVGVVAQITAIQGNTLTVQVLQGKDYDQRSSIVLQGDRSKALIVMGGEQDVKLGAIAQFNGVKTGDSTFKLNRIVILTNFVKGPGK